MLTFLVFNCFLVLLLVIIVLFSASRMMSWAGVIRALVLPRKQSFIRSLKMFLFGTYVPTLFWGKVRYIDTGSLLSHAARLFDF